MILHSRRVQIVRFSSILTADKLLSNSKYGNLETYSILWVDPFVNDAKEYVDAQQRLRTAINYIRTFKTTFNCEDYIQSIPDQDRIILIINSQLGEELVPKIHQYRQIFAIYIYTTDEKRNTQWSKEFTKVKLKFLSRSQTHFPSSRLNLLVPKSIISWLESNPIGHVEVIIKLMNHYRLVCSI